MTPPPPSPPAPDGSPGEPDAPERPDGPAAVVRTYDRIGEHFAKTRPAPWPEVTAFLEDLPTRTPASDGDRLGIDVGCGNGRHLAVLLDRVDRAVGIDASRGPLGVAVERAGVGDVDRAALVQGEATRLPVRSDSVAVALYVATLHHLPGRDRRVASLDELARTLAPGGRALVSAWSTEHDRFDAPDDGEGFDTTVDWTLPDGETVPRYYHVYAPREFDRDLAASALAVERSFVSSGNCYARVRAGE